MVNLELTWGALKTRYHLKHVNFEPSPQVDNEIYFGRPDILLKIIEEITASYNQSISPKMVLAGDWGYGKTHTLLHIHHLLKDQSNCIYTLLQDLDANEDFVNGFYYHIMSALLNSGKLVSIVDECRRNGQLSTYVDDERIMSVLEGICIASSNRMEIYKNWLIGKSIAKQTDLPLPKRIDELRPDACIYVLKALGQICRDTGKLLIFFVDEAHRLERITVKSKFFGEWSTTFKQFVDDTFPVGFIFGVGGTYGGPGSEQIALLQMHEITSRMGSRWITLPPINPKQLSEFISGLIRYARDGFDENSFNEPNDEIKNKIAEWNASNPSEETNEKHYPFTNRAIENIIVLLTRQAESAQRSPRLICTLLNNLAANSQSLQRGMVVQADIAKIVNRRQQQRPPTMMSP